MPASASTAQANPWHLRLRRLLFFAGSVSAAYLLLSYAADRIREARIRSVKERRDKDLIKAHFTSLVSTIHQTLYALLPTLHPHLIAAYPVESTSGSLQGLSASSTSGSSGPTPENSLVLDNPASGSGDAGPSSASLAEHAVHAGSSASSEGTGVEQSPTQTGSVSESWASEFREQHGGLEVARDDDMLTASSVSQPISLPTDASSSSPSPPSDMSRSAQLHPSPPRPVRSKKELWRDLKVQSITRTLSTVYLVPLLYILATSQLSVLARTRYLFDVKESLEEDDTQSGSATPKRSLSESTLGPDSGAAASALKRKGWFGLPSIESFSVTAMGLGEYAEASLHPLSYLPASVRAYIPWSTNADTSAVVQETPEALAIRQAEEERTKQEAERYFLTYSWWILHEGWREVAQRVESAVDKVFGGMPLKKELTLDDWEKLLREVRALVETEVTVDSGSDFGQTNVKLHDFTPALLPPSPCTVAGCPLPLEPSHHSPYLAALVDQTRSHLVSADARLLLEKGVSVLILRLVDALASEVYEDQGQAQAQGQGQQVETLEVKRLADCLPEINHWGQGVWEKVPDGGIETLLALPEYESFAALIFGDWAPRD